MDGNNANTIGINTAVKDVFTLAETNNVKTTIHKIDNRPPKPTAICN